MESIRVSSELRIWNYKDSQGFSIYCSSPVLFRPDIVLSVDKMFWRRGSDPAKLALGLVTTYLMYNSWALSDLNIRDDRV